MRKKISVVLVLVVIFLTGCKMSESYYMSDAERDQQRIMWQVERKLDHERIVNDCIMYNTCRGNYAIYNSDPQKRD